MTALRIYELWRGIRLESGERLPTWWEMKAEARAWWRRYARREAPKVRAGSRPVAEV